MKIIFRMMEYNKIKEGKYLKKTNYFEDMWLALTFIAIGIQI